ncbi:MAG: flippase-like domain-containing protein [Candidatus Aenigmarchaeota archaeon]|nr:flippase-like domain-containing protein [Candidatus Aenigmarchaeota archaeon]
MKKMFALMLLSLVMLVIVVQQWAGIENITTVVSGMNMFFLGLIILLPFATLLVYSTRWRLLLRSVGIEVRLSVVFRFALIGAFINYLTPMVRFGGEPVKGYMLSNYIAAPKRKIFASVAMDTIITFISVLLVIYYAAFSLSIFNILDWFTLWLILSVVMLPLTLGIYMVYEKRVLNYVTSNVSRIAGKIKRGTLKNLQKDSLHFRDNLKISLRRRDILAKSLGLAVFERFLEVLTIYIIFLSLGAKISLQESASVLGVGIMAGSIPLLPGGLVLYESSAILVLGLLGMPSIHATAGVLIWRFASYWLIILAGFIASWLFGIRVKKRRQFFKFGS